jgi:hypothetical protein
MNNKIRQILRNNRELLNSNEVIELINLIEEQNNEIEELNYQNFELKDKIRLSKEIVSIEFIRELYYSCNTELNNINNNYKDFDKKETDVILKNLIDYIIEFSKDNKIGL